MEDMQEQASDTMICHFGISPFSLAEAVLKTAKNVKNTQCMYGVPFIGQRQALHKRILRICSKQKPVSAKWKIIQCSLVFSGLLSILLGRFCIL